MQPQALAPTEAPEAQSAPLQRFSSSLVYVYKGGTPDAPGLPTYSKRDHPLSILCTPLVHSLRVAMDWIGLDGMAGFHA
jgi:hypothetical protein